MSNDTMTLNAEQLAQLKAELKAEILTELRQELGLVGEGMTAPHLRPEEESAELLDRMVRRSGADSMDNLVEEHLINRSPR